MYAVPESCLPSASLFLLRGLCRDKWRGFRITARRSRIRYLRRSIAFNSSSSDTRDSPCFLFRQMEFEFPSRVTCILKNLTYRAKSIRTFIPPPVKENIRVYFRFRSSLFLSLSLLTIIHVFIYLFILEAIIKFCFREREGEKERRREKVR